MKKTFSYFTKFEWALLVGSVAMLTFAFVINPNKDVLTFVGSLIGAVALVFLAKANIAGLLLTVVFSTLYGIVSFKNQYYGEVITYVCMTMPSNIVSIVAWFKHPFRGQQTQVEIANVSTRKTIVIFGVSATITVVFYFVLKALGTASLVVSTISIFTSTIAVLFGIFRSKYYALGYATNDVVLIVLWVIATIKDTSNLCMVICFVVFLVSDVYAFINWTKLQKQQKELATKASKNN